MPTHTHTHTHKNKTKQTNKTLNKSAIKLKITTIQELGDNNFKSLMTGKNGDTINVFPMKTKHQHINAKFIRIIGNINLFFFCSMIFKVCLKLLFCVFWCVFFPFFCEFP